MNISQVELLSPAGSIESVYAAVNNGCNAVYIGGKRFGARAYAGNFDVSEIEKVCDYCHLRGVKVYVAVNTLYKDSELNDVLDFVRQIYNVGADAVIIQDVGIASLVKDNFKDLPIHASTQMTVNSFEDAQYYYENGFDKIVLSRELSLNEIENICKNTDAEIETFVHGALCVCYSGQCIMSSMLGGRSGNRGKCAQTCRLPYNFYNKSNIIVSGHILSPKDIQTITILPELIKSGISSFKIEGRMKSPEYVAGVTGIYRKYIDMFFNNTKNYRVDNDDIKILLQLFNRGGFTEGYYKTHSGSDMISIERPKTWGLKIGFVDSYKNGWATIRTREPLVAGDGIEIWTKTEPHVGTNINRASKAGEIISVPISGNLNKNDVVYKTHDKALMDSLKKTWEKDNRKTPISSCVTAKKGKPISLKLYDSAGSSVYVEGDVVEKAQNQPITFEKLKYQIEKMGNTPFYIDNIDIDMDDDIYIGISGMNKLRREASDALEASIIKKSKRSHEEVVIGDVIKSPIIKNKKITALVNNIEQFNEVVIFEGVEIIYFELNKDFVENYDECIKKCHLENKKLFAAMPSVYREYVKDIYNEFIEKLLVSDIDGFLVRSAGQFDIVKDSGKEINIDYSFNTLNSLSAEYWFDKGADIVTLSPELNLQEISTAGSSMCEMLVYGHIPLMTTHQCPIGNFDGGKTDGIYCNKRYNKDNYYIKDRKNENFIIMTDCDVCICKILNGKPLFTLKFFDEILYSPTGYIRIYFTVETPKQIRDILNGYYEAVKSGNGNCLEARLLADSITDSTKGHYFRGIE